ncbi:MAG: hypothetical protein HC849_29420, partial [Oscillatoriales cyanobacterium RU_3_3]|nr:hypothetical protein [Oscillatoriales cyanobacterium RU_3_3]
IDRNITSGGGNSTHYRLPKEGRRKKEEGRGGVLSYHCECVPGQNSKLKTQNSLPIPNSQFSCASFIQLNFLLFFPHSR